MSDFHDQITKQIGSLNQVFQRTVIFALRVFCIKFADFDPLAVHVLTCLIHDFLSMSCLAALIPYFVDIFLFTTRICCQN